MTEDVLELVSNTADGVMAVDREQRIVFWNEAAQALLGFSAQEVRGRACCEVFRGRDGSGRVVCDLTCPDLTAALGQKAIPAHDLLVSTKAGRDVWLSVSTLLVPSTRHDLCVLVHLFRDVTAQKELERSVEQLLSVVAKLPSARSPRPPAVPSLPPPGSDLTRRERQVLSLLASGASTKVIAAQLFISPPTVRNHVQRILAKLGVHSQLEAVALSLRSGLV